MCLLFAVCTLLSLLSYWFENIGLARWKKKSNLRRSTTNERTNKIEEKSHPLTKLNEVNHFVKHHFNFNVYDSQSQLIAVQTYGCRNRDSFWNHTLIMFCQAKRTQSMQVILKLCLNTQQSSYLLSVLFASCTHSFALIIIICNGFALLWLKHVFMQWSARSDSQMLTVRNFKHVFICS